MPTAITPARRITEISVLPTASANERCDGWYQALSITRPLWLLGQTAARYTPSFSFRRHTQSAGEREGFRGRAPHMGRDDTRSTGRREGYNRPGLRLTTMDLEDVSHFHKRCRRQAYACGISSIPIARLATSSLPSQAPGQDRRR
jgi:hypothetical protein